MVYHIYIFRCVLGIYRKICSNIYNFTQERIHKNHGARDYFQNLAQKFSKHFSEVMLTKN